MKAKRMPSKYSWRLLGSLLLVVGVFLGIQYQKARIAELEAEEAQAALALAYQAEANGERSLAAQLVLEQAQNGYYDENLLRELVFGSGLVMRLDGHRDVVKAIAVSADGQFIASGGGEVWDAQSYDTRVLIWSMETGEELAACEGHRDSITSVAFSPINQTVLSASRDGTMRLWQWHTGTCETVMVFDSAGSMEHEAGRTNLSDGSRAVYVWDVAFSPDGRQIVSAGNDGRLLRWDVATGTAFQDFVYEDENGRRSWVNTVAISPDGTYVLSGADAREHDGTDSNLLLIHRFDSSAEHVQGYQGFVGHRGNVISVAINPTEPTLFLSASRDGTVRYWDMQTGDVHESAGVPNVFLAAGTATDVESLAISPDGLIAAFGTGLADGTGVRQVYLWDLLEWHPIRTFENLDGAVWDLAFSPDGNRLVAAMSDGTVLVWNLRNLDMGQSLSVDELLGMVEARFGQ